MKVSRQQVLILGLVKEGSPFGGATHGSKYIGRLHTLRALVRRGLITGDDWNASITERGTEVLNRGMTFERVPCGKYSMAQFKVGERTPTGRVVRRDRRGCLRPVLCTDPIEDFWKRVNKTDGCWLWTGSKGTNGYGRFTYRYQVFGAHRYSYALAFGPVPEGLNVLDKCDTPLCVNPEHLFLGTGADNVRDMVSKGRDRAPKGSKNAFAKLTEAQVVQLRALRGTCTQRDLAKRFHISESVLSALLNRRTWRHV